MTTKTLGGQARSGLVLRGGPEACKFALDNPGVQLTGIERNVEQHTVWYDGQLFRCLYGFSKDDGSASIIADQDYTFKITEPFMVVKSKHPNYLEPEQRKTIFQEIFERMEKCGHVPRYTFQHQLELEVIDTRLDALAADIRDVASDTAALKKLQEGK